MKKKLDATSEKKKKKKGPKIKFGKIKRVDPEKEKKRKRDARTRKQMKTA